MRLKLIMSLAVAAWLLGETAQACGCKMPYIRRLTPAQQAMQADIIGIGSVVSVEPEFTQATMSPGAAKTNYVVVLVKLDSRLFGTVGLTHVRVGYLPNQGPGYYAEEEFAFNGLPMRRTSVVQLQQGFNGCFFLQKHHDGEFYVLPQHGSPLNEGDMTFNSDVDTVKQVVKIRSNPVEALQAKKSDDRKFAAAILISQYRSAPRIGANQKLSQEPINAEESKLILQALAQFELTEVLENHNTLGFQQSFWTLGLTDQNGWVQPQVKEGQDHAQVTGEAMKTWLKNNSEKYRIQRYVVEAVKTPASK